MELGIKVTYEYTDNIYKAEKWLDALPGIIACDFETASMFPKEKKKFLKNKLETYRLSPEDYRSTSQQLMSQGLSHPSLTVITHFSFAWTKQDAKVIICSNSKVRKFVYSFLTSTDRLQIWHNCLFDFKHILYNTGKLPKNYEDTVLLSKCLLNNCNPILSQVGLKKLMKLDYGEWGIAKDEFELEEMWKESTIRYAATDATATFKLYQDIQWDLKHKWKI